MSKPTDRYVGPDHDTLYGLGAPAWLYKTPKGHRIECRSIRVMGIKAREYLLVKKGEKTK